MPQIHTQPDQLILSKDDIASILRSAIKVKTTTAAHMRDKTRPSVDEVWAWALDAAVIVNIISEATKAQIEIEKLEPPNGE